MTRLRAYNSEQCMLLCHTSRRYKGRMYRHLLLHEACTINCFYLWFLAILRQVNWVLKETGLETSELGVES
jgi:hypothetical protein